MSRNLRTPVPVLSCHRKPAVVDLTGVRLKDSDLKLKQKHYYDVRHRVHDLPPLHQGDTVFVPQMNSHATVQQECGERSFVVFTPKSLITTI